MAPLRDLLCGTNLEVQDELLEAIDELTVRHASIAGHVLRHQLLVAGPDPAAWCCWVIGASVAGAGWPSTGGTGRCQQQDLEPAGNRAPFLQRGKQMPGSREGREREGLQAGNMTGRWGPDPCGAGGALPCLSRSAAHHQSPTWLSWVDLPAACVAAARSGWVEPPLSRRRPGRLACLLPAKSALLSPERGKGDEGGRRVMMDRSAQKEEERRRQARSEREGGVVAAQVVQIPDPCTRPMYTTPSPGRALHGGAACNPQVYMTAQTAGEAASLLSTEHANTPISTSPRPRPHSHSSCTFHCCKQACRTAP